MSRARRWAAACLARNRVATDDDEEDLAAPDSTLRLQLPVQ